MIKRFDLWIIIPMIFLVSFGIAVIYSAGINFQGQLINDEYLKQIAWAILGILAMVSVAIVPYGKVKSFALPLYILFFGLVIVTLFAGRVINGARSWIGIAGFGIQPSEFLKTASILLYGVFLERIGDSIRKLKFFVLSGLFFGITIAPILVQPDMGTSLVYIPIFLVMTYIAGGNWRHLLYTIGIMFIAVIFLIAPTADEIVFQGSHWLYRVISDPEVERILLIVFSVLSALSLAGLLLTKRPVFKWFLFLFTIIAIGMVAGILGRLIIREFQMLRLIIFLDPNVDPQGAGWNIIQSINAVGSGGLNGVGFLQGPQSHGNFLPEKSTDFVFAILSEEFGFIGSSLVLVSFLIIILRLIYHSHHAIDSFGVSVLGGIVAVLFTHVVINVGMAMGLMPITGIPLLLISYGGSGTLNALIMLGLSMNIRGQRI